MQWIKWWWLFGSVHRCNSAIATTWANDSMNCYFNKNALLSPQQHFANTHTRSSLVDFPSGPMMKTEKLQTMAIFLNFWSITLVNGNTHTFQAMVFSVFGKDFRKSDGETQVDKRTKKIAFNSNKWELVAFCAKDSIVLKLMWLSLPFSLSRKKCFWAGTNEFAGTFHLLFLVSLCALSVPLSFPLSLAFCWCPFFY